MRLTTLMPLALLTAAALAVPTTAAAATLPEPTLTVTDGTDPGAAYDITRVTLRAAPTDDRAAVVVIRHDRKVAPGDAVEVWFDLDNDKVPDVHLSGSSFSEYVVHLASSFDDDGKDISGRDCVRLSMSGRVSKVRLFPACLGQPTSFRVAVKSSGEDGADDWAPGRERFTKRVLAAPLS